MSATTRLGVKEQDIQRAICDWLTIKGIFHWRANTGAFAGEYKGRKRFVRFGTPGIADIIGIYRAKLPKRLEGLAIGSREKWFFMGQFLAIEVKRGIQKQSLAQVAFQEAVENAGGIYILARSVEDVQRVLGGSDGDCQ